MTRIRAATPADLPALLAIQSMALDSPQPALLRAGVDGPATVLVAGDGVGYALAVGTEPTYLAELAVAPGHRGTGHGSMLLNAVARDGECRLTARADDARVREFYERHGFRVEQRFADHYDDADGLLMVRQPDSTSSPKRN